MAEMEFTNKLLKEAVADALTVRQTAIENAKLSLEETFTPQIKSMIERRLRAEAASETPFEDGEAEGSSEMPADSSLIGNGDNKEPSDDSFDSADDDASGEAPADSKDDWYEDWSDSDFDLDEVISELEEDANLLEMGDFPPQDGEDEEEEEQGDEEGTEGEEDEDEEGEEGMEGEEEQGGEEGMEGGEQPAVAQQGEQEPLKFTLDEFVSMMREAGYAFGAQPAVAPEAVPTATAFAPEAPVAQETYTLEEMLSMLEAEDAQLEEADASEQMASEEVQALQEELAEYRSAFEFLRGKLTEVNLLNAKLLYTNKIFRKSGLTNEQKMTIVENFDRATTVREVKMVYAVLAETLTADVGASNKRSTKRVVTEGFASKATPSTAPKATEIISEDTFAGVNRFKQLAGLLED